MMAVSGVLVVALLLFVVAPAVALVVVAVLVARAARVGPGPAGEIAVDDAPAAYRRALGHARTTAWTSWSLLVVASVVVAFVAVALPDEAPPQALAIPPAAAGLAFLAACAWGELTWPQPVGSVRRAPLVVRTAATVAPARLRQLVWGWAALLVVTLLVTGVTGGPGGTQLTLRFGPDVTSSAGPYPGWRYGATLAAAALVVVAACEAVLALVARRPAVADTAPEDDHRLRRVSAQRVLAGVQLVLAVTAGTVLVVAGNAARSAARVTWSTGNAERWTETTSTNVGAVGLGLLAQILAVAVFVTGVVVTVVALSRAASEASQPLAPPPEAAGGLPEVAPS